MTNKEQELKQFASDLATDSNGWLALDYCKLVNNDNTLEVVYKTSKDGHITIRLESGLDTDNLKSELKNRLISLGRHHETL
nr:MAG TPA: hypothetical protein [Caudoviricetes sp.]